MNKTALFPESNSFKASVASNRQVVSSLPYYAIKKKGPASQVGGEIASSIVGSSMEFLTQRLTALFEIG
jgi:hypothetical protein